MTDTPGFTGDQNRTVNTLIEAAEMGLSDSQTWWLIGRMARIPDAFEQLAAGVEMIKKERSS